MHSQEVRRVEAGLQFAHGLAQDVGFAAAVQADVVIGGLDPVDLFKLDEDDAAVVAHGDAVGGALVLREALHQFEESRIGAPRPLLAQAHFGALQRVEEAAPVERFQQIIERVHFEGADRVVFISGGEDDQRAQLRQCFKHFKAIEFGHLDVEEQDIRACLRQHGDRLRAVGAFTDDFTFLLQREQPADASPRQPLIVHDQHFEVRHGPHSDSD